VSSTGPSDPSPSDKERKRNAKVAIICAAAFFGMVGAAYAAVPIYRAFCQLTGFDGTPRRADKASDTVLGQTVTVRFDANVRELPWTFTAQQTSQQVKIGETKLAFFKVRNNSDKPITARALYNVVPESAGQYFHKLQCFCFEDQTIAAGAEVDMPVLYYIDPKWVDDIDTKGEPQVTLSYTFFPATDAKPIAADAQTQVKVHKGS
jgi:cytochrome c oxidase assembly protein subunit 11